MEPKEISAEEANALLEEQAAVFLDVRDQGSWRSGHIPGALHIGDHNIHEFVADAQRDRTTIVYCYHGYSSLGGAAFLNSEGFSDVYSMTGGFAAWPPRQVEQGPPAVASRPPAPPKAEQHDATTSSSKPAGSRRRKLLRRLLQLGRRGDQ